MGAARNTGIALIESIVCHGGIALLEVPQSFPQIAAGIYSFPFGQDSPNHPLRQNRRVCADVHECYLSDLASSSIY